jgi:hypothetical protein
MAGLAGVYKKSWAAGTGQCCGNFSADMPGFAHPGDDYAAFTAQQQIARLAKIPVYCLLQAIYGSALQLNRAEAGGNEIMFGVGRVHGVVLAPPDGIRHMLSFSKVRANGIVTALKSHG